MSTLEENIKEDSKETLKLFVWRGPGTLQDHGSGLVCVLAYNFEQALQLISDEQNYAIAHMAITKYEVFTSPAAFLCRGGG